jgi:hypothetical protein
MPVREDGESNPAMRGSQKSGALNIKGRGRIWITDTTGKKAYPARRRWVSFLFYMQPVIYL